MTMSGERNKKRGRWKKKTMWVQGKATKSNEMIEKEKLRCLSQSHCKSPQRGSEVKGEEWMAMKSDINIALSQARLRCENGLQFVRQHYCQAISLSPLGKFSTTQTDTHIQGKKKKKLFLRQIIKLQLHGAAFVICFYMLRVIIPDWRILKHLHGLGHSAVKIIGETLINLPWNQLKSEQSDSKRPEGGGKRTCWGISMGEKHRKQTHEEMSSKSSVSRHPWPTCQALRLSHKAFAPFAWQCILAADALMSIRSLDEFKQTR